MDQKPYFSNISPRWPLEKQRALLGACEREYVDELAAALLRRRDPKTLETRADILRPMARQTSEVMLVAAWPVLAFGWTDFADVIAAAHRRNLLLRAVSTGDEIAPNATPDVIAQAIKAFANEAKSRGLARTREDVAEAKRQETLHRIAKVRPFWHLRHPSTLDLRKIAGSDRHPMAHATLKDHLGSRRQAQEEYELQLGAVKSGGLDMTRDGDDRPANSDMVEGFSDGYDLSCPEPSANRSDSYRHGFAMARRDKGVISIPGTARDLRRAAKAAMEADDAK